MFHYTFFFTFIMASAAFALEPTQLGANYTTAGTSQILDKRLVIEQPAPAHSAAGTQRPARHELTRQDVMRPDGSLQQGQLFGYSTSNVKIYGWDYITNNTSISLTGQPLFQTEDGAQLHPHMVGGYNIYSPFLLLQPNPETERTDLVMYFSGWRTAEDTANGTDAIYRTQCANTFGECAAPQKIISHESHPKLGDGRFLYQVADPSIVRLNDSENTEHDFYLMYTTVDACSKNDPAACKAESIAAIQEGTFFSETNYIYYTTSWADDGVNWSQLYNLHLENMWLPSAVNTPEGVYIYANSTEDGAVYRTFLGKHGVEPATPELVRIYDELGNEITWGISNVDVTYREDENGTGYYQILAERFTTEAAYQAQVTQIDMFQSSDGLTWEMAAPGVVVTQPGGHRVNTPTAHPLTHCWVYFGENPAIDSIENPAYSALASLDFNIYGYNWCQQETQ